MHALLRTGLSLVVASLFAVGCVAGEGDVESSAADENGADVDAVSDELSTTGPVYQAGTELTTAGNLKLRSEADIDGRTLVVMPRGSRVVVTEESGGNAWVAVRYGDHEGWAHTDYLMDEDEVEGEGDDDPASGDASCGAGRETAYENGRAIGTVTLMKIGSKKTTYKTGHAFLELREKMAARGVTVSLNSGFRTQSEQQYFYNCYRTGRCNNGNLAAKPGYSNHQNGRAVDLSISNHTKFRQALSALGLNNQWRATVASERWHWEYFGDDPGGVCN